MSQWFEDYCSEPTVRKYVVRFIGNGAGTPTKVWGNRTTITRVGAGDYKITFAENPFKYLGVIGWTLQSATMTDIKGYTIIVKDYDAVNFVVEFTVYNSTFTATDLTSAQSINLVVAFKETNA